jgi:hypothetical protein
MKMNLVDRPTMFTGEGPGPLAVARDSVWLLELPPELPSEPNAAQPENNAAATIKATMDVLRISSTPYRTKENAADLPCGGKMRTGRNRLTL